MPIRVVQSKQNARLKELRQGAAARAAGRGSARGNRGTEALIEEALRAGLRVSDCFCGAGSGAAARNAAPAAGNRNSAAAEEAPRLGAGHRNAAADCRACRAAALVVGALLGSRRKISAAGRGPRRPSGSRQPGHDPALGRGLWRNRRRQPARNRERLESESRARLGGQRLPRAVARRSDRRVL